MKNDLKKLTRILFDGVDLSSSIYNDTHKIDELTQAFNRALGIQRDSIEALMSTHLSETVIAPLPFYGLKNKAKFDFVYIQLTPDYDNTLVHLEKQGAGDKWQSYFEFYTSQKSFDFMKQNLSFYRNLCKLFFAFNENHELGKITLEDIAAQMNQEHHDVLNTMLKGRSILLPYVVPFHAHGFSTNMNGINQLRKTIPSYDAYLNHLLAYINTQTEDHGVIMSCGFADSRVVHSLIEENGGTLLLENQLFTLLKWDTKFALLLNDPLISRHGLRSDLEIDQVLSIVKHLSHNEGKIDDTIKTLKSYCENLLEARTEKDFKDRGQRIKGIQLKSIGVKKLKKYDK